MLHSWVHLYAATCGQSNTAWLPTSDSMNVSRQKGDGHKSIDAGTNLLPLTTLCMHVCIYIYTIIYAPRQDSHVIIHCQSDPGECCANKHSKEPCSLAVYCHASGVKHLDHVSPFRFCHLKISLSHGVLRTFKECKYQVRSAMILARLRRAPRLPASVSAVLPPMSRCPRTSGRRCLTRAASENRFAQLRRPQPLASKTHKNDPWPDSLKSKTAGGPMQSK